MENRIIGYVKLKEREDIKNEGNLTYEFTDILTDELEKKENKDLKERIIVNITNLHEIFLELIKRSE